MGKINSNPSNVRINTDYLKEIHQRTGLSKKDFSESLGRHEQFLSSCEKRGYMPIQAAKLVCRMYGENIHKLVILDEPKPQAQEQPAFLCADDETLAALVRSMQNIEKGQKETDAKLNYIMKQLSSLIAGR